jgi:NADP-dependent 3-hydroxy acid dehydrogenase YdfG
MHKIVVVSGASSGIGKAIALALAAQENTVCVIGRNLATLSELKQQPYGQNFYLYRADLHLDEDIHTITAAIQTQFGGIDILVHSAGVITLGTMHQANITDFDYQYRINTRAPYLLTQAFLPLLKQRGGQVVFINSSVGITAKAGLGQYAASKHALKAIADSLRQEVNTDGVRVMSIYPGRTAGTMQKRVHLTEAKNYQPAYLLQPNDVAEVVLAALNLPRTAEITDIHIRPLKKT